jgi:CRISPR-associated protein Cas1
MLETQALTQPEICNDEVVIVEGYGVDISVIRGHLVVKDGFASEGTLREIYFPRGHCDVKRIVVRAPAGNVSIAALDWCNRMGLPIAFVGSDSRLVNCLIPDAPHDGPVKRAQAICAVTDDGARLVRWLLTRKFESEAQALEVELPRLVATAEFTNSAKSAVVELRSAVALLGEDSTLDALLSREGRAAQAYWKVLAGTRLNWPDWAFKRNPNHWARIWPRESGGRARVRDARDPFNAILNYCYTLLEVEGRVACAATGLDPDLGLLHVDDRLRESFIYDLVEPLRARVDVLAFEFVYRRGLRPFMFHELRRIKVSYQLTRFKLAARIEIENAPGIQAAAPTYRGDRTPPARPGFCDYCNQQTPKRRLKFCDRQCYLRHSVEIRQPLKLAQAKLSELRAQGLSPGHGGAAAKLRGAKISQSNKRRAMNLSPAENRALRAMQARVRRGRQKVMASDTKNTCTR